jgi:hypothetical protein
MHGKIKDVPKGNIVRTIIIIEIARYTFSLVRKIVVKENAKERNREMTPQHVVHERRKRRNAENEKKRPNMRRMKDLFEAENVS